MALDPYEGSVCPLGARNGRQDLGVSLAGKVQGVGALRFQPKRLTGWMGRLSRLQGGRSSLWHWRSNGPQDSTCSCCSRAWAEDRWNSETESPVFKSLDCCWPRRKSIECDAGRRRYRLVKPRWSFVLQRMYLLLCIAERNAIVEDVKSLVVKYEAS